MDKYTLNLKTEKIQKLVRQGDFATAAKIADGIEWKQEKSVRLLMAVSEAYEKTGRYTEATNILLQAYDKTAMGKHILYKLTELAVASGAMADAETFYTKYLEEAPEDSNRYILRFLIAEAKGEDLERQITILEAYKKQEFEEEWAYKLAKLYQKVGREKECVSLCDQIILWFGVGPYVNRAMELKEVYEPLTAVQRDYRENHKFYEERVQQVAAEMENIMEKKAMRSSIAVLHGKPSREEKPEEPVQEKTAESENTENSQKASESKVEVRRQNRWKPTPADIAARRAAETANAEAEERFSTYTAGVDVSVIKQELERVTQGAMAEAAAAMNMEEIPEESKISGPDEDFRISLEESEIQPKEAVKDNSTWEMDLTKDLKNVIGWKQTRRQEAEESEEMSAEAGKQEESEVLTAEVDEPEESEELKEEVDEPEESWKLKEEVDEPEESEELKGEVDEPEESEEMFGTFAQSAESETAADEIPDQEVSDEKQKEFPKEESEDLSEGEMEPEEPMIPALVFEETEKAAEELAKESVPYNSNLEHCLYVEAIRGEDGLAKAVALLGEYYQQCGRSASSVTKIMADRLNHRGLVHSLPQLSQKDLIIDQAGGMSDQTIREMLKVMGYLDPEKVFVLIDRPQVIKALKERIQLQASGAEEEPELKEEEALPKIPLTQVDEILNGKKKEKEMPKKESKRVQAEKKSVSASENLGRHQELSEKEFIRYIEDFAKELECVIDDSGFDALEEIMEDMIRDGEKLTKEEAELLVEDAADHAEKPSMRRMFASKYDKEGYLILRKKDFV